MALRGGVDLADPDRADVHDSVLAQLGPARFEAAYAGGQALTRVQASAMLAEQPRIED